MSAEQILELSNNKSNLAVNSILISIILITIIAILLIVFMRKRRKQIWSKTIINYLVPIVFIIPVLLSSLADGFIANEISSTLKKDSSEMITLTTSGKIDNDYTKAKTRFIVINKKSYIYVDHLLKASISVGKKYNIKYLSNSGLIVEMEKISVY